MNQRIGSQHSRATAGHAALPDQNAQESCFLRVDHVRLEGMETEHVFDEDTLCSVFSDMSFKRHISRNEENALKINMLDHGMNSAFQCKGDTAAGWQPEVDEIAYRHALAAQLGGEEKIGAAQAAGTKLTVRERIACTDKDSFVEVGSLTGSRPVRQHGPATGGGPRHQPGDGPCTASRTARGGGRRRLHRARRHNDGAVGES